MVSLLGKAPTCLKSCGTFLNVCAVDATLLSIGEQATSGLEGTQKAHPPPGRSMPSTKSQKPTPLPTPPPALHEPCRQGYSPTVHTRCAICVQKTGREPPPSPESRDSSPFVRQATIRTQQGAGANQNQRDCSSPQVVPQTGPTLKDGPVHQTLMAPVACVQRPSESSVADPEDGLG